MASERIGIEGYLERLSSTKRKVQWMKLDLDNHCIRSYGGSDIIDLKIYNKVRKCTSDTRAFELESKDGGFRFRADTESDTDEWSQIIFK